MFVISLVIMAVLVAADQLIKLAVTNNLPLNGQPVEVIKFGSFKVFSLTHIRNSGAAWSMMSGKTWFLIGLPVVVLIVAVIYMYKIRKGSKLELVSLAMVLAGGIGNLIDRIRVKEVVDYSSLSISLSSTLRISVSLSAEFCSLSASAFWTKRKSPFVTI